MGALLLAWNGSSDEKPFQAGKAADYAHQLSDQVLVGAKAFDNADLVAEAFGKKTDLLKYGVLPILIVIENKRDRALDLNSLEVSLVATDGRHASPVSPDEIQLLAKNGHRTPKQAGVGVPFPLPQKKNPLAAFLIEERAFAARMLPPGDSTSGFFYFEAHPEAGDSIYLSGMKDARNGKEILYFEFPLKQESSSH